MDDELTAEGHGDDVQFVLGGADHQVQLGGLPGGPDSGSGAILASDLECNFPVGEESAGSLHYHYVVEPILNRGPRN